MRTTNRRTIMLSAALAVTMGLALTAQAAVIEWNNTGITIDNITTKWTPNGLPTVGVNSGMVKGNSAPKYGDGFALEYDITFNDTSSLVWNSTMNSGTNGRMFLRKGAIFKFNDSSSLTVSERLYIGGQHGTGTGELTLAGNATATVGGLSFGWGSFTVADVEHSGRLTLRGDSIMTTSGTMNWGKGFGQSSLTHYLTLADSAALTVNNTTVVAVNAALLVVNFEQVDNLYTPTWTIGEAADFNQATIQYQINGVDTTLSDSRFVQEGNTLSLTVIPEPAALGMMGFGTMTILLLRRMYR